MNSNKWLVDIEFLTNPKFHFWKPLFNKISTNRNVTLFNPHNAKNSKKLPELNIPQKILSNNYDILLLNSASPNSDLFKTLKSRTSKLILPLQYGTHADVISQIHLSRQLNVDLIISELLPDEIPLPFSLESEKFFLERYIYIPPCLDLKKNKEGKRNKKLFIYNSKHSTNSFIESILPTLQTIKLIDIWDLSKQDLPKYLFNELANYNHCTSALSNPQENLGLRLICSFLNIPFTATNKEKSSLFRHISLGFHANHIPEICTLQETTSIRKKISNLFQTENLPNQHIHHNLTDSETNLGRIEARLFNLHQCTTLLHEELYHPSASSFEVNEYIRDFISPKQRFWIEHSCARSAIINYLSHNPPQADITFISQLLLSTISCYKQNPSHISALNIILQKDSSFRESTHKAITSLVQNGLKDLKQTCNLLADLLIAAHIKIPTTTNKSLIEELYQPPTPKNSDNDPEEISANAKLKLSFLNSDKDTFLSQNNNFYNTNPSSINAFSEIGSMYDYCNQKTQALQFYKFDYALNKKNHTHYLRFLIDQEQFAEAESLAIDLKTSSPARTQIAIGMYKKYFDSVFNSRITESTKEQLEKIVDLLNFEVNSNSYNQTTYDLLGLTHTCLNNPTEADIFCQKSASSNNPTLYARCALIFYLLNQKELSSSFSAKQQELSQGTDQQLFLTSISFFLNNHTQPAINTFHNLYKLYPQFFEKHATNLPTLLWRGMLLKKLGSIETLNEICNSIEDHKIWPNILKRLKEEPLGNSINQREFLNGFFNELVPSSFQPIYCPQPS